MTTVAEIAPDVFRISTFVPEANLTFNQFLVRDEEPLLFHTGMNSLFEPTREAIASVLDPATIRWIGFSHFEADECGSLNDWLPLAPKATAICSFVGAITSLNDFAIRAPKVMMHDEVLETGKYRFRFRQTPHVPHCWDAGLLFEEVNRTLFSSDLFTQAGEAAALTHSDVVQRSKETLMGFEQGPLASYMTYNENTATILRGLADLKPATLATMHGSSFAGDGEQALLDLNTVLRETLSPAT
jgi:flavorubredoxin